VRNICFTPPTPPSQDNPKPPPPPPPTEPCLTSSPDYLETVTADGLPFFENFYAGGVRSIRGFKDNTVGPRAQIPGIGGRGQVLGGALKTVGSVELFFPQLLDSPSARVSTFVDFGNVYRDADDFDAGLFRASAGMALLWRSPLGPISISYAFPLKKEDQDETERLQFTFGGAF
jgi:outer membrane protein insertion porin family